MSPWQTLLTLAERELELLRRGELDALPAALDERDRLAATLGQAPASARPVLERLAAVQDQIVAEITLARDEAARELAALHRGRGAVQGYRSAAGGPARTIDAAF
jgi:hypothetical protein